MKYALYLVYMSDDMPGEDKDGQGGEEKGGKQKRCLVNLKLCCIIHVRDVAELRQGLAILIVLVIQKEIFMRTEHQLDWRWVDRYRELDGYDAY